jgi:hypothetical protein
MLSTLAATQGKCLEIYSRSFDFRKNSGSSPQSLQLALFLIIYFAIRVKLTDKSFGFIKTSQLKIP